MSALGNIIWLIFGGIFIPIEYVLASFALMITIIGIPFGLQTLKLAELSLFPFGKNIRRDPQSNGCLCTLMNIIWFFVGSIPIVLTHFVFGLLFYITIIGIPFGHQHFKLMRLALTPFVRRIER